MTAVEILLKNLILIPSPSGDESKICLFIYDFLKKQGFELKKIPVGNRRFNIVAVLGSPNLYLSAHLDTVPPMLKYKATKSFIYGRGSCDTKGSVAGMIAAAIACKEQGCGNFGLIFTVGEETSLDGVQKIVESKINIPFVVVGEPTGLGIVNGHFGILIIKISARGKASHSSQPEKGINAIDRLLKMIQKVKLIEINPETLMSLVQIKGGRAENIIPDEAEAVFSFRISPHDKKNYFEKIKSLAPAGIKVEKIQEVGSIFCQVPQKLSFIKSRKTVKYFTELSYYKKGIVLGPGDIKYAHGTEEKLSRKELLQAVKIYSRIIKNFQAKI